MPGCNMPDCFFTVRSRFLRPFFTISRGDATLERCHTSYLYGYYSFFQTPLPPFSVVLIGPFSDPPPSTSFGFAARKERTAISQQPCRQLAKVLCVRFPPLSQASLLHRPLLPLFPGSHSLPGGEGAQLDCARIRRRLRTADYTLQEVFPTNYDPSSSSSLGTFFLFFFKAEFIEGKADKKMAKGAKKMTIMCPASDAHIGRGEGGARPSLHTHHHNLASVTSSLVFFSPAP